MSTLYPGYFADPFVTRAPDGAYYAYGTSPTADPERVFEVLSSPDLVGWRSHGRCLRRPASDLGETYWAPEVARADGRWWMYYSVGRDIAGHHLRVAVADDPVGPFTDLGLDLTPDESFAIDPHPFRDADGSWYLFFARDVLDDQRAGTHLAVAPLEGMTRLGRTAGVLRPSADWQMYERERRMYGRVLDWHTLEGPAVVRRGGRYWLTYSGGNWTTEGYHVSWAVADEPLGPWHPAPEGAAPLLATGGGLVGPGHNSLTVAPDGTDTIVFHSWDEARTARRMHALPIEFAADGPRVLAGEDGAGPAVRAAGAP